LMAVGSFLLAVGLLTIPHDATFVESWHQAARGFAEGKREIIALGSVGLGLAFAALGAIIGLGQRKKTA
jgi:hypothetical protein